MEHKTAEDSRTILKSRLKDHNLRSLSPNTLHHTLNRTLTEIVAVAFHRKSIYPYNSLFLFVYIPTAVLLIASGNFKHAVCYKIFTCTICLYDCFDQILWYIFIIRQ